MGRKRSNHEDANEANVGDSSNGSADTKELGKICRRRKRALFYTIAIITMAR